MAKNKNDLILGLLNALNINVHDLRDSIDDVKARLSFIETCGGNRPEIRPPGKTVREEWWIAGILHRDDAPALIERNAETGKAFREEWYAYGKRHRHNAPAFIRRNTTTGYIDREEWWDSGLLHCSGAPAVIIYDGETGEVIEEQWWQQGEFVSCTENPDNFGGGDDWWRDDP